MGKKGGPTGAELGPRAIRILDALMATGSIPKAAEIAGVDRSTAWRLSKTLEFQKERQRRLEEQGRRSRLLLLQRQDEAWDAIAALLRSSDERIRMKVALWIAGRGIVEAHTQDQHPSPTELDLRLDSLERRAVEHITRVDDEGDVPG